MNPSYSRLFICHSVSFTVDFSCLTRYDKRTCGSHFILQAKICVFVCVYIYIYIINPLKTLAVLETLLFQRPIRSIKKVLPLQSRYFSIVYHKCAWQKTFSRLHWKMDDDILQNILLPQMFNHLTVV